METTEFGIDLGSGINSGIEPSVSPGVGTEVVNEVDHLMNETKTVTTGWVDTLKNKLHMQDLFDKLGLTSNIVTDAIVFLVSGFLAGFLVKRYVRYAVTALLAVFLALKGLENAGVVVIDWVKLQNLVGLQSSDTVDSIFSCSTHWISENVIVAVSFAVGLLMGMKFG